MICRCALRSLAVSWAFALGACGPGPEPASTEADEARLRALIVEEWPAAAKAGDVDAYLSFLDDGMVYMPPNEAAFHTKAEVGVWLEAAFASATFDIAIDEPEEIVVTGPWAYARYHVSLVAHPADGSPDLAMDRKYMDIWRRQADGSWKAHRHMWNDNPVPGPA